MISKRLPGAIFGLLILQFLLGMLANLYQTIPSGAEKYSVYHHVGFIFFHVLNAAVLLVLAIVFLVKVIRRHLSGQIRSIAIGGAAAIVVAYACGITFVETNNDIFSLLMALAFLGAFMSYARCVFIPGLLKPKK